MEKLIHKLRLAYPHINFRRADTACWSPDKNEVSYRAENVDSATWTVLHEVGHALLEHRRYTSDMDLLQKEVAAWEKARLISAQHSIVIDSDYIQDCLDTYRDWLHKRSQCPECNTQGLEQSEAAYSCLNCKTTWKVTANRFCRPYRLRVALAIE